MKKVIFIIVLTLVLVLALASLLFVFLKNRTPVSSTETPLTLAKDPMTGLSFEYNPIFRSDSLTDKDKKDMFIFRLTSVNPAMLVSVRYEDGLKAISSITRQEPIDLLLGNAEKSFPIRYADYKKLEVKKFTVNNRQAAELIFTYKGPNEELAKQRLLIIMKDDNTAVYIAAQAQESDFEQANNNYFDKIFSTITFDN